MEILKQKKEMVSSFRFIHHTHPLTYSPTQPRTRTLSTHQEEYLRREQEKKQAEEKTKTTAYNPISRTFTRVEARDADDWRD